jgi:sugar phosphate isomerase/epimerase
MILAVSNIAWTSAEAASVYRLLARLGVAALEAAPGVLFPAEPNPLVPSPAAIRSAIRQADDFGLRFVSMQAVHFGRTDDQLFGDAAARAGFVTAVEAAIRLSAELGIGNIVLGSPRNRIVPFGMTLDEAMDMAAAVLSPVGDLAVAHGVVLSVEPNPLIYGGNFITDLPGALAFHRHVAHAGFGLNLDLGERICNAPDDDAAGLAAAAHAVTHMQISAPSLAPPLGIEARIAAAVTALAAAGYDRSISIEMRRSDDPLDVIARVVSEARSALGPV